MTGRGARPEIHSVGPSTSAGGPPEFSSMRLQLQVAYLKRSLMQPGVMRPPKSSEPYCAKGPKHTSFWPLFLSPQAVPVMYLNCSHQEPQPSRRSQNEKALAVMPPMERPVQAREQASGEEM